MIITKIRVAEEHPMTGFNIDELGGQLTSWPIPFLDLELNDHAGDNGYLLKNSSGLGPTTLAAIVIGFDSNGIPIKDVDAADREIALRIQLTPTFGQSFSELRSALYKFNSKGLIVSLMDGARVIAQTHGLITVFDTLHFTNQPEIQLTIECEDGYFEAPAALDIPVDAETLELEQPILVYEEGDAPTGFKLEFEVTSNNSFMQILNYSALHSGRGSVSNIFTVTYPMVTGDLVTLNTHPSDRRITLIRGTEMIDLAGYVNAGAVWPMLQPGVNVFEWFFGSSWMTFTRLSYIPRYWGV